MSSYNRPLRVQYFGGPFVVFYINQTREYKNVKTDFIIIDLSKC